MRNLLVVLTIVIMLVGCTTTTPGPNTDVTKTPVSSKGPGLGKGKAAYDKGEYAEAVKYYNKYLSSNPDDAKILFEIGRAYNKLRKYPNAMQCFKKALEKNPKELRARVYMSGIFYTLKKFKDSENQLELTFKSPLFQRMGAYEKFLAYFLFAQMKNMKEEYEEALRTIKEANKLFDLNVMEFEKRGCPHLKRVAIYHRAIAYKGLNEYYNAAKDMEQYVTLAKQAGEKLSSKPYKSIVFAYYMLDDRESCKKFFPNLTDQDLKDLGEAFGAPEFFTK